MLTKEEQGWADILSDHLQQLLQPFVGQPVPPEIVTAIRGRVAVMIERAYVAAETERLWQELTERRPYVTDPCFIGDTDAPHTSKRMVQCCAREHDAATPERNHGDTGSPGPDPAGDRGTGPVTG